MYWEGGRGGEGGRGRERGGGGGRERGGGERGRGREISHVKQYLVASTPSRISASAFFLFILVLTFATEMATSVADPTSYNNAGDYIRGFCEVVILLVLAALFLGEIIEMVESR